MAVPITVSFTLEEEVLELLNDTVKQSGESRDTGVATIITLWARNGFKDEDELIDRYIEGARLATTLAVKSILILIGLIILGSWVSGKISELIDLSPVFIGSYVIFFLFMKLDNIRTNRILQSPETMLKKLRK
ncbi:hypothetical protein [Sphingomonas sp.]|uniref:hypothetical protein n=1 Tax=Sphingomonas sp. TaxID=28214 RepID=UPI003751192F